MLKRIPLIILLLFCLFPRPISASAVNPDARAGKVTTAGSGLNVRASAASGAPVLASLPNGSYVTLIGKSGSWWRVEYASGQFGYCHADYIQTLSGTAASVTASALNVRSGPSTGYGITGYLHRGQTVIVLSSANGWSKVLHSGIRVGYVSQKYLTSGYRAVSLTVPQFRQTDSRWASLQIGESGKTFAQIGCATTAIAMMESHRTGHTVYPDEMARSLDYTPSGSVYWPKHYAVITDPQDYLAGIYSHLTQGKPVLFGVKNDRGSQHWVVITGFTGGERLTPSGFTIHDPGTASRTNLQQLISAYPQFYKFFHY